MELTDYQAKYFAYELTKRSPSDSMEKLAGAVASAQVDLNPHQVDAALFAFRSPLSKGALLADEVGLGKTIEAGLVLSQKWAERRRRILIIVPSNLRKQWHQEITEKFFLPCSILETKSYNAAVKTGNFRPFEADSIVICSYQFARNKAADVANTAWNVVVIDEAHRLRNVYKPSNVIANTLKLALSGKDKLLLTATPLQNSLLELFGLVSFIDEHIFGDLKSFREQFANLSQSQVFDALKARLKEVCHRTLRRQVIAYIPFTRRLPLVEEFTPEESEDRLYDLVSEYLRRENLQALPASQRSLMTLVLRKLLASSTFAIAGALTSISQRLKKKLEDQIPAEPLEEELDQEYEALEETAEEWPEDDTPNEVLSDASKEAIRKEVADLDEFAALATSIESNAKGKALLKALGVAFAKATELGAAEKAIIFTESRRTQTYLLRVLGGSQWAEGIVLFNGSNTDERSRQIYAAWLEQHQGTDRVSGSKTADMRSALVDYFREEGRIMIATEAGAEGINLQFCSLVVNYDLPWNPQRIEQRIGRCHRYGQKHDVVVVNFLNRKNAADKRVYELLSEKFHLFEGIFGASDEVLGAIESGVDFEKRINDIYQRCRKHEEIKTAFDQLQLELSFEINEAMTKTRQKLLENFDDEVREKLREQADKSERALNKFEQLLIRTTRHELNGHAEFLNDSAFSLLSPPFPEQDGKIPLGLYELPRRTGEAHLYRLNHPLAEAVLKRAKERAVPLGSVLFNYSGHKGKVAVLQQYVGRAGWLRSSIFTVEAMDQTEDYLLLAALTDDCTILDQETAHRLLTLPGSLETSELPLPPEQLELITHESKSVVVREISERNAQFFEVEVGKLEGWAEDLKLGLERDVKDFDRQIKEARRAATIALSLEEKLAGQKRIKALESQRGEKRRSMFDAQDKVDSDRGDLIASIESKLTQKITTEHLFTIRWRLA
jgi:ERCC4-related helicase